MNNNLEFENEDPSPDSIEDNHPRTNYGEGYYKTEKMKDEFIIISKTAIQKRIKMLKVLKEIHCHKGSFPNLQEFTRYLIEQRILEQILSQSTPLIPEIEKAFDIGSLKTEECYNKTNGFVSGVIHTDKQDFISNLKLDI
jgi:hypothetical protein